MHWRHWCALAALCAALLTSGCCHDYCCCHRPFLHGRHCRECAEPCDCGCAPAPCDCGYAPAGPPLAAPPPVAPPPGGPVIGPAPTPIGPPLMPPGGGR